MPPLNTTELDRFKLGKQAALDGDISKARELLGPLADQYPHHAAVFFLCQIESQNGSIRNCEKYCHTFLAKHPRHAGMRTVSAILHIANGDLKRAENDLKLALETKPDRYRALQARKHLDFLLRQAKTSKALKVLDQKTIVNATAEFSRLDAAKQLRSIKPYSHWDRDALQAKIAFFHYCQDVDHALRYFDPELIESAVELGYCSWPKKIQQHLNGCHVLDVGCGFGGYSIGYLCAGARSYTGIDPAISLDEKLMRDKRKRQWVEVPKSAREIMAQIPDIKLHQCTTAELVGADQFDAVCLHNVTEHLLDLESVFIDITKLLSKHGKAIFLHHNYYGWSGHHMPPYHPEVLDKDNPEHVSFSDWNHIGLTNKLEPDHYIHTNLNQVRINDLRKLTQDYFHIETWDLIPSPSEVLERFTPEILKNAQIFIPDLTREELETNAVFCVATTKQN